LKELVTQQVQNLNGKTTEQILVRGNLGAMETARKSLPDFPGSAQECVAVCVFALL
jgi:hypothetical protein